MKISESGINLIKEFEGLRLEAYQDIVGVWTIGYGHTGDVAAGRKISEAEAEEILRKDLAVFEEKVAAYDSTYHWTQNEFDALVSFAFNIGGIGQLTQMGTRTKAQIAEMIPAYNHAGGRVVKGLTDRRLKEQKLFLTPIAAESPNPATGGRTRAALVAFVISKLGTPYVYGAHGGVLTVSQLNAWAGAYPSVYTASYYAKAKTYIGERCTDCAGLLDWFLGQDCSAQWYRDNAKKRLPVKKIDETMIGWAVWKPGHIGVYVGNGKVVEAKGIKYGTILSDLADTPWLEVCQLHQISYEEDAKPELETFPCKAERGLTIVGCSSLRIRDYPRTGNTVGSYSAGTKIYPSAKAFVTPTDVWLKTSKGWISRKYLEGWIQEQDGKWYVMEGDTFPANCLKEIDGKVYAFSDAGWLLQGGRLTVEASEDGSISLV